MAKYRATHALLCTAVALALMGCATQSTQVAGLTAAPKVSTALPSIAAPAPIGGVFNGNRYMHERYYAGDISAARAFLGAQRTGADKIAIVDVRDASEYERGHPAGARHIPFPRVYQDCQKDAAGQAKDLRSEDGGSCLFGAVKGSQVMMSPKELFEAFEAAYPNKEQALALLCRTGSRSAKAGNILSKPEKYLGAAYQGRGYKNVSNIWEGFVGMPVVPIDADKRIVIGTNNAVVPLTLEDKKTPVFGFQAAQLDLNNDGKLNNEDLDGWRYHQGLPFVMDMTPALLSRKAQDFYGRGK